MHLDGELALFAVLGGEHSRAVPHRDVQRMPALTIRPTDWFPQIETFNFVY